MSDSGRGREGERERERERERGRWTLCEGDVFAQGMSVICPSAGKHILFLQLFVFKRTCALGNHVFPEVRVLVGEAEVQTCVAGMVLVVQVALVTVSRSDFQVQGLLNY